MQELALGGEPQVAVSKSPVDEGILSADAQAFVVDLTQRFRQRVEGLLAQRRDQHARLLAGESLRFLPETRVIRESDWKVAPVPKVLERRTVEITGPVDRKMIINALNSGADVFMADFEDANSPTWQNVISGQRNLYDAVRGDIEYTDPASGKSYRLDDRVATLFVRPRGLHLPERHLMVDGKPAPAALVDAGLYLFHNARELVERGLGPFFYLPKLESHLEARWWNEVFDFAESYLGIAPGTIKATVLIETLQAAFEMDEILFALRDHSAGLNCGRWDYIFSFIKCVQHDPTAVFPDRSQVTMTQPCMRAYTQLAVQTCHRRGAHAIGGMAAYIPVKGDEAANDLAMEQVRQDKLREANDGHDGTWVAHPALVPVARRAFEEVTREPNQLRRLREDLVVKAGDLLEVPAGTRTEEGLRLNVRVAIQYLEAWLRGRGAVPLYNLMEDAATAEISRTQVWQWVQHRATLEDGREVTAELVSQIIEEEMAALADQVDPASWIDGRYGDACELFKQVALGQPLAEFLTLPAYRLLTD